MTASDKRLKVRFLANSARYSDSSTRRMLRALRMQHAENSNAASGVLPCTGGAAYGRIILIDGVSPATFTVSRRTVSPPMNGYSVDSTNQFRRFGM